MLLIFGDNKACGGKMIFGGDGLHEFIRQPFAQQANPSGIARKNLIGKGIYMINRKFHTLWYH
jgi:hypothetical protein